MKFKFHNKVVVDNGLATYTFFNTMLKSVYAKLKNLKPYGSFVSVGTGTPSDMQENFKLTNFLKTYTLEKENIQDDITASSLFVKKSVTIDDSSLDNIYLTELGLSENCENPNIFNYISLLSEDLPNGIKKESGIPLILSIFVYIEIDENSSFILTAGNNKFIDFLLGEGIDKPVFASRGNNYSPNKRISREMPTNTELFSSNIFVEESDNSLTINFSSDLKTGETNEIVFLIGNEPFSRINLQDFNSPIEITETLSPKTNYILDLKENVKTVESVTNLTTNLLETDIFPSSYANDFADKITLPFSNMFDSSTPRFLSKDGDKIFFVLDDAIFAYKNTEYQVKQIETGGIVVHSIFKIVAFDDYVFIISKIKPFIYCYKIINNSLKPIEFNLSAFEYYENITNAFDIDITIAKNGMFMIGAILSPENYGYTIYFSYDENINQFVFDSYQISKYNFSYVLAMFKNNFSDSRIMFLKEGEHSAECRIVSYFSDKTYTDVFSNLAYYYTYQTKEIYTKNRAVIVEKTTEPHMWIYYYPQMYRYNLPLLSGEVDDFVSTNLLYLIQKTSELTFKIYNLVGYNTPTEFTNGFPKEIDQSKIVDFEFLNDTLLIFLSDANEPIVAYNFKENCAIIENVSSNEDDYEIKMQKFNLLGSNNEGVVAKFSATINI